MNKCFLVVYNGYEGEDDYIAFSTIEKAREDIVKESEDVSENLTKKGYKVRVIRFNDDAVSIYVPDSNISYHWEIVTLEIK